jgi:hypothetical protein
LGVVKLNKIPDKKTSQMTSKAFPVQVDKRQAEDCAFFTNGMECGVSVVAASSPGKASGFTG